MNLSMTTFALVHTLISLAGIVSGFVVVFGMMGGKRLDGWTSIFLLTTLATSATGFGFPFRVLLPAHVIGIISLVILAGAIAAYYVFLGLIGFSVAGVSLPTLPDVAPFGPLWVMTALVLNTRDTPPERSA